MRAHKKRVKELCKIKYGDYSIHSVPKTKGIPTFPLLMGVVFRIITLKLELRMRKFRKKDILIPVPMAPWRGARLGLNMLFKNAAARVITTPRPRKIEFLYRLLDEFWDIFHGKGVTCKNVLEFTEKALESSENYALTPLFPVSKFKRSVVPGKIEVRNRRSVFPKSSFIHISSAFQEKKKEKQKQKAKRDFDRIKSWTI